MPDKGGSDSLPSVFLADAQIGEKWLPKKTPRFVASVANDDTLMSCHEKALGFDFIKSVSTKLIKLSNGSLVAQVAKPNFCRNWECHGGCLRRLTFELSGRRRQDAKPGLAKCTMYRQTGPGGLPLALRLSDWLGRSVGDDALAKAHDLVLHVANALVEAGCAFVG